MSRVRRHRVIGAGVYVLGLAGLVIAVRTAMGTSDDQVLPDARALAVAAMLAVGSLVLAGRAWAALFGRDIDRRAIVGALYVSQLAKYLPAGGLVQAAGQAGLSLATGVGLGQVTTALAVFAMSTVVAGCTLSAGLVLVDTLPAWARALSVMGIATPLLLRRGALVTVLAVARRLVKRMPESVVPSQRSLLTCWAWSLGNVTALSLAYAVLVASSVDEGDAVAMLCGFAASWVAGFLVFPLPGGIGVREAMLVAVVPGVPAASLVAASVALRLVTLAAEVVVIVANRIARQLHRAESPATSAARQPPDPRILDPDDSPSWTCDDNADQSLPAAES